MSRIHWVGGEKGGVGKSVFARVLSQYFIDKSIAYIGLDADQSHASLTRYYGEFTQAIVLDHFESTDRIMEIALEREGQVLMDLPAQSERFLDRWLEENDVLGLCAEVGVSIVYWYVLDDGVDSARLLRNFLTKYGDLIPCVAIKNQGCGKHFTDMESTIAEASQRENAMILEVALPALHGPTMHKIDKLGLSFWGAVNHTGANGLNLMERQRTKVWLKKAHAMLDGILEKISSRNEVRE